LLVKSADILSNVSETLSDYAREGDSVLVHFNAPKEKIIGNHMKVITAILARWPENPLAQDLSNLVKELEAISEVTS
jgi:hypothetical protein